MSRTPRRFGKSKTYHIILKGIDNQEIFYDNQDRQIFLKQLLITKKQYIYNIYAYCLMDNNVHMIIKSENEIKERLKDVIQDENVSEKYIRDFLNCEAITFDKLRFIYEYGSKKAKRITVDEKLKIN